MAQRAVTHRRPRPIASRRRSATAITDAARYLVGGVNSPVRAFQHTGGDPLWLSRSRGGWVWDVDGRRYVDFIMGWGAKILGHGHPAVIAAIRTQLSKGDLLGLSSPLELALARQISEAMPLLEQIRFTASGTEACITAVKLARAQTKRRKILACAGCYHGHGEGLMAGQSAGIPSAWADDVIRIPYDDAAAFDAAVSDHGEELACVIIEPVAANMGVVAPDRGYLERVRQRTSAHGILLIFDEVVTGFRLGYHGAQGTFGIRPDLTTLGKIIGGGLPIGAVGGPRRLMEHLAPVGPVYHGGTFAGHSLSMAAGLAALGTLEDPAVYQMLERLGRGLEQGLLESARRARIPIQVNRCASMMTVFFSDQPVTNYAGATGSRRDRFGRWARALRQQGILVPPSPFEALFVSTQHTPAQIRQMIRASFGAFTAPGF